jgi:hypothetical protein
MSIFGYKPSDVRKAIAGGVVAVAPLLVPDLADGVLSGVEVGGLVAAFIAGAGVVFGIPNAERAAARNQPPASSRSLY